ncbi:hypothetical protein K402DRAFT_388289 [Aulographum hederae CBS 113979]|uniref:Uncharacterized protein n=1 Tax=Aulographum hederae CBS 113979 TaxID=1176131 RepID=A0A6G1HHY7_9PEZI|nr:hypothetical protein K402DRAFT_388289 [Aulographum hederae CBS 113979]
MPALTRANQSLHDRNIANASHKHLTTPQRARIRGGVAIYKSTGVWNGKTNLRAVFKELGVSETAGKRVIRQSNDQVHGNNRTFHNAAEIDTRGAQSIIDLDTALGILIEIESRYNEERSLSWAALAWHCNLDCHPYTLYRELKEWGYGHYIAARKSYLPPRIVTLRFSYADAMLSRYPDKTKEMSRD